MHTSLSMSVPQLLSDFIHAGAAGDESCNLLMFLDLLSCMIFMSLFSETNNCSFLGVGTHNYALI